MATFTPQTLAFIQLADAKGDITSTPGADKKHLVHTIVIHNINGSAEDVELLYNDGTNEYQLLKQSVGADETVVLDFGGEGVVIEADGKLTGMTTTASMVTCWVSGTERDDS